ncbi:hypothetical protein CgunFtcFv8_023941 [Champsocephalus gunnari]|uniref:Uncharacterized protein n=1 Tax=Champsocephalus gunnari TaxID=52237 RepID=A0AAN8DCE5_CHAGU|nr:hypothetical protein CgunFtcFv8_023941 [Champsocephalus gunnari]
MAIVPYSCIAQEHRRSPVPVARKASPTPSRPSGSGRGNTMRYITLPPSMEAVMTEYRYYNAGVDPDTKLSENVRSKVKRYQDPSKREVLLRFMCHDLRTSNRYYASNPGVKEALGIRYMFQQSFAQATMDAQAEAGMEPEAAGPSAARASERQSERHPLFEQGELQPIVPSSAAAAKMNELWFTKIPPVIPRRMKLMQSSRLGCWSGQINGRKNQMRLSSILLTMAVTIP